MRIFIYLILLILSCMPVMAYNLDLSVDKEIQTKYDSDKLNKDMKIQSAKDSNNNNKKETATSATTPVPKTGLNFDDNSKEKPVISADNSAYKRSGIRIPRWTSFKVKSNQKISDWLGINSVVSFTTTSPVYKKSVTIQTGTVFKGTVTKTHHPQITGNGGLVEIKITGMVYNGKTYPVSGRITKANSELIFFNNIKGDRQYINGVEKKMKSATNFYKKSRNISNKLSQNPLGTVIAPIPTIVGFVGGTVGTIISPVTGLVEKGKNVSYPSGTEFEIRLSEEARVD